MPYKHMLCVSHNCLDVRPFKVNSWCIVLVPWTKQSQVHRFAVALEHLEMIHDDSVLGSIVTNLKANLKVNPEYLRNNRLTIISCVLFWIEEWKRTDTVHCTSIYDCMYLHVIWHLAVKRPKVTNHGFPSHSLHQNGRSQLVITSSKPRPPGVKRWTMPCSFQAGELQKKRKLMDLLLFVHIQRRILGDILGL